MRKMWRFAVALCSDWADTSCIRLICTWAHCVMSCMSSLWWCDVRVWCRCERQPHQEKVQNETKCCNDAWWEKRGRIMPSYTRWQILHQCASIHGVMSGRDVILLQGELTPLCRKFLSYQCSCSCMLLSDDILHNVRCTSLLCDVWRKYTLTTKSQLLASKTWIRHCWFNAYNQFKILSAFSWNIVLRKI